MGGRTKALVGWLADRSVRRVVVGSFGIVAEDLKEDEVTETMSTS